MRLFFFFFFKVSYYVLLLKKKQQKKTNEEQTSLTPGFSWLVDSVRLRFRGLWLWGKCWNVEFGHAADACPPRVKAERTDGRLLGRAQGSGFAPGSWESLRLSSPARRAAAGLIRSWNEPRCSAQRGKEPQHRADLRTLLAFSSCGWNGGFLNVELKSRRTGKAMVEVISGFVLIIFFFLSKEIVCLSLRILASSLPLHSFPFSLNSSVKEYTVKHCRFHLH